jgi:hypothetical protein
LKLRVFEGACLRDVEVALMMQQKLFVCVQVVEEHWLIPFHFPEVRYATQFS